jgi:hypothetical protein
LCAGSPRAAIPDQRRELHALASETAFAEHGSDAHEGLLFTAASRLFGALR